MAVINKEKIDFANKMLAKIYNVRSSKTEGGVAIGVNFLINENRHIFEQIICFHKDIPKAHQNKIVWQCLAMSAQGYEQTLEHFVSRVTRLEKEFLKLPKKRMIAISGVTISSLARLPLFVIDGAHISFPEKLSGKIEQARQHIMKMARYSLIADPPTVYKKVRIGVNARNDAEAADVALDALQLLIGIWNLYFNRKLVSRISNTNIHKPINRIAIYPIHTVHYPNGELVEERWWYEQNYCIPTNPHTIGGELVLLLKYTHNFRKVLNKLPENYKTEVKKMLKLYNSALDDPNPSTSLVRMWQVLEQVSFTDKNETHTNTVERASVLFEDTEYHRNILKSICEERNSLIHQSEEPTTETSLYILKRYVERFLVFHLINGREFGNKENAKRILNYMAKSSSLDATIKLQKMALKLRKEITESSE